MTDHRNLEPGERLEIGDEYLVDGKWQMLTEAEYTEWVGSWAHYCPEEGMAPFRRPLNKAPELAAKTRQIFAGAFADSFLSPLAAALGKPAK